MKTPSEEIYSKSMTEVFNGECDRNG